MKSRFFLTVCMVVLSFAGIGIAGAKEYPDWEEFQPFYSVNGVIEFQGQVYGTTTGGVFRYNPETNTYTTFYKDHGLTASDPQCVAATSRYLYFGFATAGLMRFDPETDTFEQIVFPEYISNGVGVNSIYAANDTLLYVGHTEGLDVLNLVTKEVRVCTRLGDIAEKTEVNAVAVFNGKIWACTSGGLAVADVDDPNIDVSDRWTSYTYVSGINCILHVNNETEDSIYLGTADLGVARFDVSSGKIVATSMTKGTVNQMTTVRGLSWLAGSDGLFCRDGVGNWGLQNNSYLNVRAIWGTDDRIWVATPDDGLQCYTDSKYISVPPVPGAKIALFTKIDLSDDGALWATSSLVGENGRCVRFKNNTWDSFLMGHATAVANDGEGNMWITDWGLGVNVVENASAATSDSSVMRLDPEHAIFLETEKEIAANFVVCDDIMRDSSGRMWVANLQVEAGASSGAVVVDGFPITRYRHFSPAGGEITTSGVSCIWADDEGWVWMGTSGAGIMAVHCDGDPLDASSPFSKYTLNSASSSDNALTSLKIKTIRRDTDGYVWVGTDAGLTCITTADNIAVGDSTNLLSGASREVLCIEVDRFKNKWIGTAKGLVRITAANTQYAVYTTDNSGLLSNKIYSLKYDDENDVLWVGTDAGLNRFNVLGETSETNRVIRVYPNPFSIWGTDSRCTFPNLLPESKLRVFTFRGDLVNELTTSQALSDGSSSITWDGRNFKNEPVASGVYFFTGVDKNNKLFRDKIAVVRR